MRSIKVILTGIVFILASLFFLGICILNRGDGPDGLALVLFVTGIAICAVGLFFIRDNIYIEYNDDEDEDDDDEEQPDL